MGTDIQPRSSWEPRYADGDLTLSGLANEVFAHHTVTAQLSPSASVADEKAEMRKIEATGQDKFGAGISYNVIIFPSGRAYQGVSWNRRGAHTGGKNSTSRSICFAGNYEENEPTIAQLVTASTIYHEGKGKWWERGADIHGHRDVSSTACPGRHVYSQLPAIRAGIIREEPEMLSDTQNNTLNDIDRNVGEIETIVRQLRTKSTRQEAHIVALMATIETLARNIGADSDAITAAITKSVDKALEGYELVLRAGD